MAITPQKNDSRSGKEYSYLFALLLTAIVSSQSVNVQLKINPGGWEIAIASRELNAQIFYPCVVLIAGILGLPTDALAKPAAGIALAFGHFLTKGRD